MGDDFVKLGSQIAAAVQNGLAKFASTDLTNALSSLTSSIHALLSGIQQLVPLLSKPVQQSVSPLPHLAEGGIVSKPTVALVGEKGPEAVVPLDRRAQLETATKSHYERLYGPQKEKLKARERKAIEIQYKADLTELEALKKSSGASPRSAPATTGATPPVTQEHIDTLTVAVKTHGGEYNLASLYHVRQSLSTLTREHQDAVIKEARKRGLVSGANSEGRVKLSADHLAAQLPSEETSGARIGFLSLRQPEYHAAGGLAGTIGKALSAIPGAPIIHAGLKQKNPLTVFKGLSETVGSIFRDVHEEVFENAVGQHNFPGAAIVAKLGAKAATHVQKALGFAQGGLVDFKPKGSDTVPAMLTPGERVIPADKAAQHKQELDEIQGKTEYLAGGGTAGSPTGGGLGAFVGIIGTLVNALRSVVNALGTAAKKVSGSEARKTPQTSTTKATQASQIANQFNTVTGGTGVGTAPATKPGSLPSPSSLLGGSGGGESVAGGLAGALGAVGGAITASIAIAQQMAQTLSEVLNKLQGFVEALNPNIIQNYNRSIADLSATVGTAFTPLFEILATSFRQISGLLLPIFQELKPVVEQISQAIGSNLVSAAKLLTGALQALTPAFEALATVMQLLSAVITPLASAFLAFIQTLFGSNDTKSAMQRLADTAHKVTAALLLFIGALAKVLGANTFLKNLIDNLTPKEGEKAAAQGVGLKSFEQISKDIAIASSFAVGTGEETKKNDLNDVVGMLQEIQKGSAVGLKEVNDRLGAIAKGVDILVAVATTAGTVYDGAKAVGSAIFNPFGTLKNAYNAAFGG